MFPNNGIMIMRYPGKNEYRHVIRNRFSDMWYQSIGYQTMISAHRRRQINAPYASVVLTWENMQLAFFGMTNIKCMLIIFEFASYSW